MCLLYHLYVYVQVKSVDNLKHNTNIQICQVYHVYPQNLLYFKRVLCYTIPSQPFRRTKMKIVVLKCGEQYLALNTGIDNVKWTAHSEIGDTPADAVANLVRLHFESLLGETLSIETATHL